MYVFRILEIKQDEIKSEKLRRIAHAKTPISKYFVGTYMHKEVAVVHIGVQPPPGPVFIYYLYVLTDFRSRGFGGQLVEAVEAFARQNGNAALELEPGQLDLNFPATEVEAWYQRRGYQPASEDGRIFRKSLDSDSPK